MQSDLMNWRHSRCEKVLIIFCCSDGLIGVIAIKLFSNIETSNNGLKIDL